MPPEKGHLEEFEEFLNDVMLRTGARHRAAETIAGVNCHGWADSAQVAMISLTGLYLIGATALTFKRELGMSHEEAIDYLWKQMQACQEDLIKAEEAAKDGGNESPDTGGADKVPGDNKAGGVS